MRALIISVYFSLILTTTISGQDVVEKTLMSAGLKRDYNIFVPGNCKQTTCPIVLVLHGGGGNSSQVIRFTNFIPLAAKENFIVVYPNGLNKGWNDGRIAPKQGSYVKHIDDIRFISDVIDTVVTKYHGDARNVFATGISNGGMMSIYLAYKLSAKISAVAPVAASIPENLEGEFKPTGKVPAVIINGTGDKLVPYLGGPVLKETAGRGNVIATEKMFAIWSANNGHTGEVKRESMQDVDSKDGCQVEKISYDNDVVLIKINGGGHTWPGGSQYLPKSIVGNVCRDFNATETIWAFFKDHLK